MRPPIVIKNTNRFGKVTNKWHVRVDKEWKVFGQQEWENGGFAWINKQLKKLTGASNG